MIRIEDLPRPGHAHRFAGEQHGSGLTLLFFDGPPGSGPALHRHPYEELFVVQEGEATFRLGDEQRVVRGGEIVVAPSGVPHAFTNSGDGPLRQIDIHVAPETTTEWLED